MSTIVAGRKAHPKCPNNGSSRTPKPSAGMLEALEDVRLGRNLHGPYATVKEAMCAMLEG